MRVGRLGVAVCGAVLCSLVLSASAFGKVFTRRQHGRPARQTPGNGTCATAVATCTLRAAIQESNLFVPSPMDPARLHQLHRGPHRRRSGSAARSRSRPPSRSTGTGAASRPPTRSSTGTTPSASSRSARPAHRPSPSGTCASGTAGSTIRLDAGGAGILTSENTTLANVVVASNQITGDGPGFGAGIAHTAAGTTLALTEGTTVTGNTHHPRHGRRAWGRDRLRGDALALDGDRQRQLRRLRPPPRRAGASRRPPRSGSSNSTISSNSTAGGRRRGRHREHGPALGSRSIVNSTISTNSAGTGGGGGAALTGTVAVTNSTFALNASTAAGGGGLDIRANAALAMVTVKNTIIGSSTAPGACFAVARLHDPAAAQGFNIDAGTSCGFGTANGNQENTNPLLGAARRERRIDPDPRAGRGEPGPRRRRPGEPLRRGYRIRSALRQPPPGPPLRHRRSRGPGAPAERGRPRHRPRHDLLVAGWHHLPERLLRAAPAGIAGHADRPIGLELDVH